MSQAAAGAGVHHDHKAEESRRFHAFVNLALFMALVTGAELVIIFLPWASWVVMTGVIVLSVVKFFGVITWFMHLVYDNALLTVMFLSALLIAVCTVAALLFIFGREGHYYAPEAMLWADAAKSLLAA